MYTNSMNPQTILHDLSDGLVIRRAAKRDTDALVKFQLDAFANPDTGVRDEYVGGWTRNLMSGKHPNFRPTDFLLVEDTRSPAIVSCMCLISQTWKMGDVPFGVGRVEIVATAEPYRRRGLVREQFRVLHEWSAQRGEPVQAITGIPYYYRQFGYEYALELSAGRRTFVPQQIPVLKQGEREQFRLRRARRADVSFLAEIYNGAQTRSLVRCERSEALFEYEQFHETDSKNDLASVWNIIETAKGERAGILMYRRLVDKGVINVIYFDLLPQFSWMEVTPGVLRALVREGAKYEKTSGMALSALSWRLHPQHPFYELMGERTSAWGGDYAWYLRVADLPSFLIHLAPLLEQRLGASDLRNYSGVLRLNFFKSGVELSFEKGKLSAAKPWLATAGDYGLSGFGNATFPDLTFLKLLFGYRSRAELHAMFPDCIVDNDATETLLAVLFPKQQSHFLPIH